MRFTALPASTLLPLTEQFRTQHALRTHDVQDVHVIAVLAIEDATWRLNNLPITPALELRGLGAALGMSSKLPYMLKYALDQPTRRFRIIQCDVVGNRVPFKAPETFPPLQGEGRVGMGFSEIQRFQGSLLTLHVAPFGSLFNSAAYHREVSLYTRPTGRR